MRPLLPLFYRDRSPSTTPDGPFALVFCAAVTDAYDRARNAALYPALRPAVRLTAGSVFVMPQRRGACLRRADAQCRRLRPHPRRGGLPPVARRGGFGDVVVVDLDGHAQSLVLARH